MCSKTALGRVVSAPWCFQRSKSCSVCKTVTSHSSFLLAICLSILGESSLLKPPVKAIGTSGKAASNCFAHWVYQSAGPPPYRLRPPSLRAFAYSETSSLSAKAGRMMVAAAASPAALSSVRRGIMRFGVGAVGARFTIWLSLLVYESCRDT